MSNLTRNLTESFDDFFVRGISVALNQNYRKDDVLELYRQRKLWTRNIIDKGSNRISQIIFYNGIPLIGLRCWTEFEESSDENTATLKVIRRAEFFPVESQD